MALPKSSAFPMSANMGPWGKSEPGERPDRLFWVDAWTRCSAAGGGLVVLRLLPVGELRKAGASDDSATLRNNWVLSRLLEASFERPPRGRPPRCFDCRRSLHDERRPFAAALVFTLYSDDDVGAVFAYAVCAECAAGFSSEKAMFEEFAAGVRRILGARNITGRIVGMTGHS
jgi:hypothetical protein